MSVADTPTLLPLARWARIMGIDPLHFQGVFVQDLNTAKTCSVPIFQHGWQSVGKIGREEIAEYIADAERMVAEHLGYWPAPTWIRDERHESPRPWRRELYRTNFRDARGQAMSVQLKWAYLRVGGQRAVAAIDQGAPITWSDEDSDGYEETGTVGPLATGVTDPCEVRVFYPGQGGAAAWEIRPLTSVAIAAGAVTVTFRRELTVLPDLLERISLASPNPDIHSGINGAVDANFLDEVDVYRVYNDPQAQARLEWEPLPRDCDCGTGCAACQVGFQDACLLPRGAPEDAFAALRPATWNADDGAFTSAELGSCRDPDHLRLWYFSGWRWEDAPLCSVTQMDPIWERTVARLAASMLPKTICGCENVDQVIGHWREDLAKTDNSGSYVLGVRRLEAPWGTTRGALWAWQQVQQRTVATGRAVLV